MMNNGCYNVQLLGCAENRKFGSCSVLKTELKKKRHPFWCFSDRNRVQSAIQI